METLEKLRNGIDQLPKWLLLILVIFVDGLVGGLYRARRRLDHGGGVCAVDSILCGAAGCPRDGLPDRDACMHDRGYYHGDLQRKDHILRGLIAQGTAARKRAAVFFSPAGGYRLQMQ